MKHTYFFLIYIFCSLNVIASDFLSDQDKVPHTLPSADQVTMLEITPPGFTWDVSIYPDGHVSAQYGQNPGDDMALPPGSIDFHRLCPLLLSLVTEERPHSGTQVAFLTKNGNTWYSHFLRDDTILRYLITNEPSKWKTMWTVLGSLAGGRFIVSATSEKTFDHPISVRVEELLKKYPIYQ